LINIRERFRWVRKIIFHGKISPEQITFFVTNKCGLNCKHCFYKDKLNKGEDAALSEIKRISENLGEFSFLTLTGGEPFMRDDLPEIAETFILKNKVSRISIPTNGFEPRKIYSETQKILERCPGAEIIVKVSIDGLEDVHDGIRGVKGSYERAVETFKLLKTLKEKNRRFRAGILCTISKINEDYLEDAFQFTDRELKPDVFGLNFIRGNVSDMDIKNVEFQKYEKLYALILSGLRGNYFYKAYKKFVIRAIKRIIESRRYPFSCLAGRVSAVIDANLNVFPCEALSVDMGNLRDFGYDFKKLWFSPKAMSVRNYIDGKNCVCTNECNIQNNSFFTPAILAGILEGWAKERLKLP